jgi:hypothetical protein
MRMVKLFALEGVVMADIAEKRGKELAISWRLKLVEATNMVATQGIPILYLIVCYASYVSGLKKITYGFQNTDAAPQTLLFQQELTASIVFSTMSGELYCSPKQDADSLRTSIRSRAATS